jgi:uncharacterized protein YjeT (DUF2065 family)
LLAVLAFVAAGDAPEGLGLVLVLEGLVDIALVAAAAR